MRPSRVIPVLCLLLGGLPAWADDPALPDDLTELSLEELLDIEVTSVSKKRESLQGAAAAVFVITGEDIQRLGITSIPEALRLAPGVHVARVNSYVWAITARGLNSTLADKLEVLLDGRSLYNPLFSGVFWDVQDTLIEDIDRIEVIRGPGATLYGANAVNGVINIITKKAHETQGDLVTVGGGTEERAFAQGRYGGKLGDNGAYRVYAKGFERDDSQDRGGQDSRDRWHTERAGFRADWDLAKHGSLTFQGDVYTGARDNRSALFSSTAPVARLSEEDIDVAGGNALVRWSKAISERAELDVQFYYDRTEREIPEVFNETRDTVDIELQNRISLGGRNEVVWGGGYRRSQDDQTNSENLSFSPEDRTVEVFNLFAQDEIQLVKDKLSLTLGSKLEHNDYTQLEVQPSARVSFTPDEKQTVWGAVSRAVRTPNRMENDVSGVGAVVLGEGNVPIGIGVSGDKDFTSEKVVAYELGYRRQINPRLMADIAVFYNDYDDLRSTEQRDPPFIRDDLIIVPTVFDNNRKGETYGTEVSGAWQAAERLRLQAGYSYLRTQLRTTSDSTDTAARADEGNDPEHQAFLRSSLDLSDRLRADAFLRYVDALPNLDVSSYAELDLSLGWRLLDSLELSIVGQNLLHDSHEEFGGASEIERSVYGAVRWEH